MIAATVGTGKEVRFVLSPFFLGSSVQRVAAAAFLTQAAIGLAAIPLFRAAQAAGIDVQLFDASPLAPLFADAFPFRAGASVARVRFDHLFLLLVSLYAITMPLFGLVFLRALGPIVRDFRASGSRCSFLFGVQPVGSAHISRFVAHRSAGPHC